MRMVSSGLSHICISLIVAGLIVPGATLAEIELKDLAGLWLFDEAVKGAMMVSVTRMMVNSKKA